MMGPGDFAPENYSIAMPRVTYPPAIRRFIALTIVAVLAGVGLIEAELWRERHAAEALVAARIQERLESQELEEHRREEERLDHMGQTIRSAHSPTNCAPVRWYGGVLVMLVCDPDANGDPYWFLRGRIPSLSTRRHR